MHGNADCRQCGKYNTEAKIGALLCRPRQVIFNNLRQDGYIQFWAQGWSVYWGKWGAGVGAAGGWKVAGRC